MNELLDLRSQGLSSECLAQHFGVSKATVKRRLRKAEPRDPEVVAFANRLAQIAAEAPPGYCRDELNRLINNLRTLRRARAGDRADMVLESIATGAREIEEIAEDCNLTQRETFEILEKLLTENRVCKQPRGGIQNRGCKMKFHYLLAGNEAKNFEF